MINQNEQNGCISDLDNRKITDSRNWQQTSLTEND
jgi:hypothetical protein